LIPVAVVTSFVNVVKLPPSSLLPSTATYIQQQQQHHHQQRRRKLYMATSPSSTAASSSFFAQEQQHQHQQEESSAEYSEIFEWDEEDDDDGDGGGDGGGVEKREEQMDADDDIDDSTSQLLTEHERWTKAVNRAVKALGKKRNSLQSELTKAQGVEGTTARAQLLVSNLYMFTNGVTRATVIDWENDGKEVELVLSNQYDSPSAEADALFAQVRKLKRGSQVVSNLLQETQTAWDTLQSAQLDLQSAVSIEDDGTTIDESRFGLVKDRLKRTSRTTNFQVPPDDDDDGNDSSSFTRNNNNNANNSRRERKPEIGTPASNVRKLKSPGGCTVLVGRNRRGNEHISLSIARGNDVWMHSRGCPGAHVLIQNRRGGPEVTEECLQFGADLAIFYSDLRNEAKASVTAAEPKHILKPRGAPLGAVKIREEWRTFVGRPDRVPEQLKVAREESGQTDEYHMQDKALHRRRTRQAAEESQMKRRKKQQQKRKGQQ
jgi:hypothetical protein